MKRETPYFIIHEDKLLDNTRGFMKGMADNWQNSRLAYSVKTNSLPWVLKFMNDQGVMAEVVSDEEYELALMCGFREKDIIFNGPIKSPKWFNHALECGTYINIDSSRELKWIKEGKVKSGIIGIRINVPTELFREIDIAYMDDGFRFGFSDSNGDFQHVLNTLIETGIERIGLHLHCNSITRSPDVYRTISRYVVSIADKYNFNPAFIDIGGGFFGGIPDKTSPVEYFSIIAEELGKSENTRHTQLLAEPGSALIGSCVDFWTSVIDVKDTSKARIVTTDGSRIHIDPLWIKKNYMYSLISKNEKPLGFKQLICGYTCMDHDRMMVISDKPELGVGDKIVYHRVGAYTMTFGGLFIKYFPDVYIKSLEGLKIIRNCISVQDYYRIEGGD